MKNKLETFKSLKWQTFDGLVKNKEIDKIVKWVVWIVRSVEWKLFLVVEKEKKAWKKPWQLSFPMETLENWESFEKALIRWLKEEMWINVLPNQINPQDLFVPFVVFDEQKNKIILVELLVYDVVLNKNQIKDTLQFTNWEISKVKKMKLNEFLSCKNLRPWNLELFEWETTSVLIKEWEYFRY